MWLKTLTLVKKSLQPAARASCLSLCKLLAVNATMMTGLLNKLRSGKASASPTGHPFFGGIFNPVSIGLPLKTPMPLTASSRRISLVASNPFITGNWMSIKTR